VQRTVQSEEDIRSCVATSCRQICTELAPPPAATTWSCASSRDESTDCASCVYVNCKLNIDACCSNASCKDDTSILTDIGACVIGDAPGCAFLLDDTRDTLGLPGAIRGCIDNSCASRCMNADRRPHTKCAVYEQGHYCQCSNAEASSGQTCDTWHIGSSAYCVLGSDGCTCGEYTCSASSLGCSCDFHGGAVTTTTCTQPQGGICCFKRESYGVSCSCKKDTTSCSEAAGEVYTLSCSVEDTLAMAGGWVESCSR
jgi:hypothetical protein